jgi:hypothetical protein
MLMARAITSAPTSRDTTASVIIISLAHRFTAETSVGLNAGAGGWQRSLVAGSDRHLDELDRGFN